MSECHKTKSVLKAMIVFKTKGPKIRCIPDGSFGLSQCKSSSKKNMLVVKISRKTSINSKKKARKYVAFLTEGEDWLNVNRPAKNMLVLI